MICILARQHFSKAWVFLSNFFPSCVKECNRSGVCYTAFKVSTKKSYPFILFPYTVIVVVEILKIDL